MYVYSLMGEWAFDVCAVYLHMCTRYTSVCKRPFTNDVSTSLKAKGEGQKSPKCADIYSVKLLPRGRGCGPKYLKMC